MKMKYILIAITVIIFTSCGGAKMEKRMVTDLLFDYESGIVAGIEMGETWEEITANCNENWTPVDGEHQLTYYADGEDLNFLTISFLFSENNTVNSMEVTLSGEDGNRALVKEIFNLFSNKMNKTYPITGEHNWHYTAPNKEDYIVFALYHESETSSSLGITITQ